MFLLRFFLYLVGGLGISGIRSFLAVSCSSTFDTSLGTALTSCGLFCKGLLLNIDCLHFVNGLQQDTLVLEVITLGEQVKGMIDVLVDLLGVAHLFQETAQDTNTAHPQDLERQTCIGSTATLTGT